MYIFSKAFWNYSLERVLKTFAQTAIAGIAVTSFVPTALESWQDIAITAGVASLVSLLTAITAYGAASGTEATPLSTRQQVPTATASATPQNTVPLFVQK